jgi:asparagine synthase (glutamine-hydrolysing)
VTADLSADIVFAATREVVLVNGRRDFVMDTASTESTSVTWLAGSYVDDVRPCNVRPAEAPSLFGYFVIVRHDRRARKVTVFSDRFGLFPFFMRSGRGGDADRLLLGTDFEALAKRCAANCLDGGAFSDILAFHVPFEERTPLSGISSLRRGQELTIDLDTLVQTSRTLWDPAELLAQADLPFDSVKDQLFELFLEGVSRATHRQADIGITLSGGIDSRCLLAGSLYAGQKPITCSTGVPGSRAVSYARRMAVLCGVADIQCVLDDVFVECLPELMRDCTVLMHGMSFSSEVEALWLSRNVSQLGIMLHGAFAELYKLGKMHDYNYDSGLARLRGAMLREKLWMRFAKRYAMRRKALSRRFNDELDEHAREHLACKIRQYEQRLDTAGVLQMMYIDEYLGKVTKCSWQVWRQRIPTLFPFAYPPLVDLILRVRAADKIGNSFALYLLNRTKPVLASYPDSNTGVRIGASRLQREAVHVLDYVGRRVLRSKARFDHQDLAYWLQHIRPGIEAVLEELHDTTAAFEMDYVRELAARCRRGDVIASRTLQFLWACGLWIAKFSAQPRCTR